MFHKVELGAGAHRSLQRRHGLQNIPHHKCKSSKSSDDENVAEHTVVHLAVQGCPRALAKYTNFESARVVTYVSSSQALAL